MKKWLEATMKNGSGTTRNNTIHYKGNRRYKLVPDGSNLYLCAFGKDDEIMSSYKIGEALAV